MPLIQRACLLTLAAVVSHAADDASWKGKPIPQWDDQDAKQVLAESPWVKNAKLDKVRDLSKFERRDGGNWEAGIGPTVGFGATGLFGPFYEALALERAHRRPDYGTVVVRWVSALPIRAAESKMGNDPPAWQGDYYALAVYDVPPPFRFNLARELQGVAFLQREKKKDLRPARVVISRHEDGLATITYLFSRAAVSAQDHTVRFVAQIGRMWVSQYFFPEEMQFEGRPEL
jgi:hypothetical protein